MNEPAIDPRAVAGPDELGAAARILAHDMHEPPDECEHGFVLPRDCPNDKCADRAFEWAWYVGRQGRVPFDLRDEDLRAVTDGAS